MNETVDNQLNNPSPQASGSLEIDPFKLQRFMQKVKDEQNLPLGFIAGLGAAVIGAIIWAMITVVTDFQIGWMAVGVGFLVGLALRQFGKGIDKIFGFTGAALALFGCLAGNLLTVAILISRQESVSLLKVLFFFLTSPGALVEIMTMTFSPMDLLFYGIAIYEGYKFAFRRFSQTELVNLGKDQM